MREISVQLWVRTWCWESTAYESGGHRLAPREALREGKEGWVGAVSKVCTLAWGPQGVLNGLDSVRESEEADAETWASEFLEIRAFF